MNASRQFIVNASAHDIPLPDGMIHTVVTSPPYYSLRKYAGEQEVDWPAVSYSPMPGMRYEWTVDEDGEPELVGVPGGPGEFSLTIPPMRCALGLEPTPEAYIGHLVLCFREVKRVLREDGVAWVVMGDSYAAQPGQRKDTDKAGSKQNTNAGAVACPSRYSDELQAGDLMLIPHRLALALQGDGWICRNDPVFAKVAPMPESVSGWRWERCKVKIGKSERATPDVYTGNATSPQSQVRGPARNYDLPQTEHWHPCPGCDKCRDTGGYVLRRGSWRHTRAHETVLMLAKGMNYYADQERVREAHSRNWDGENGLVGMNPWASEAGRNDCNRTRPPQFNPAGRNPRSVLTPRPSSYKGDHYAVFSPDLIAPLLRATAPTRVCPVCGAAWAPVVEQTGTIQDRWSATNALAENVGGIHTERTTRRELTSIGHRPTCSCIRDRKPDAELSTAGWLDVADEVAAELGPVPGWCLDPFAGTFTTGEVCRELGVNAIGLDISLGYLDRHAKPRIGLTPADALDSLPLFAYAEI